MGNRIMSLQRIYNAHVVTPERILPGGGVECADGRVTRVFESCRAGDIDLKSCYLLPGLVDVHTHPSDEDGSSLEKLAALCDDLRGQGVARFLFATGNVAFEVLPDWLRQLSSNLDALGPQRGCLGIHLEGPYVAPAGRGGFEPGAIATPQNFPVEPLLDACGSWPRYINIAPELPGALEAIRTCRQRGLAVSIGHTRAGRDQLLAAVEAGATAVCHTFNASEIQRFKEPGVLDVTLDLLGLASGALVCELICDGIHVDPLLVKLLYRAKGADGITLITDSIRGGRNAEEGQRIEAGLTSYRVVNGAGRNSDGGLCGSTLTLARAVANFRAFTGCPLQEAVRAASGTPARLIHEDLDYGSVQPGRRAVFCVLDDQLQVREDLCRLVNQEVA